MSTYEIDQKYLLPAMGVDPSGVTAEAALFSHFGNNKHNME